MGKEKKRGGYLLSLHSTSIAVVVSIRKCFSTPRPQARVNTDEENKHTAEAEHQRQRETDPFVWFFFFEKKNYVRTQDTSTTDRSIGRTNS